MTEESYTGLARALTTAFPDRPRVTRHTVYAWSKRHTLNRAGKPFPHPHRIVDDKVNEYDPSRFWAVSEVIAWARPGVPGRYGHSWRE